MKKRILSFVLAMTLGLALLPVTALASAIPFTDVPASAWYYNDIKNAFDSGLINGKTSVKFSPDDNLTYAEAVKLAACMHQKYTTGSVTLTNGSPWYQSYVTYAKNNKIITTDYAWNSNATRGGYMEIFARALPNAAYFHCNTVFDNAIRDVPMNHPNAAAIYKLYRAGIVEGADAERNCRPSANIKRGEVAAILTRMMDASARKQFTLLSLWLPLSNMWSAGTSYDSAGDRYYFGFLDFSDDNFVEYSMGYYANDVNFFYRGHYEIITEEDDPSGFPVGTILFMLDLYDVASNYPGDGLPESLSCAYLISMDSSTTMDLQYLEGDKLAGGFDLLQFVYGVG